MTTYTSLEISKLIHVKVPKMEVTAWHIKPPVDNNYYICTNERDWIGYPLIWKLRINAYRLDDVLRAMNILWKSSGRPFGWELARGYELVESYLTSDCNLQDPKVEQVIRDIFV